MTQGREGSRCTQHVSGLGNSELHRRSHCKFNPACSAIVLGEYLQSTMEWSQTWESVAFPRCRDLGSKAHMLHISHGKGLTAQAGTMVMWLLSPTFAQWAQGIVIATAQKEWLVQNKVLNVKGETTIFMIPVKTSKCDIYRCRYA